MGAGAEWSSVARCGCRVGFVWSAYRGSARSTPTEAGVDQRPDRDPRRRSHPATFRKLNARTVTVASSMSDPAPSRTDCHTPMSAAYRQSPRSCGTRGIRPSHYRILTTAVDWHRGGGRPPTPATPPCIRVRTRRFESVTLTFLDQ
jgi:hypothetical protein